MKYPLAKGKEQDAFIIGYKPRSEKLVFMSPKRFLELAPPTQFLEEGLKPLRRKMKKGKKLDAPFLDINVRTGEVMSHEGRHRAKVSMELGIKKIPVVLFAKDLYEWTDASLIPQKLRKRRRRRR